jgi:hypothetical protein
MGKAFRSAAARRRAPRRARVFPPRVFTGLALAAPLAIASSTARADELIIKNPGDHPDYRFEAEPHAIVGYGPIIDRGTGFGLGFRGTVIVMQNGFVKTINNSVGVGFGGDILFAHKSYVYVPVVMQWNFFLSTHWSVFGEPGLGFSFGSTNIFHPTFYAGGRYHFTEKIALCLRLGYPGITVGVSFLL